MTDDATRWGKPFAALLGGLTAQLGMGVASIGGKDSMSGSFGDIDVPPTLDVYKRQNPDGFRMAFAAPRCPGTF